MKRNPTNQELNDVETAIMTPAALFTFTLMSLLRDF